MTDDNQATGDAGEGKPEFGSDQETNKAEPQFGQEDISKILKQNVHGQEHISKLETETATLRSQVTELQQDLANAKSVDDLISELKQDNENTTLTGTTSPQIDEEQLLAKLSEKVTADMSYSQQQALEQENWATVTSTLEEKHGSEYATYVDTRAKELGMNNSQIETLARSNPKAFLELISPGTVNRSAYTTPSNFAPQSNVDDKAQSDFSKVARLKGDLETPEGREANRLWNDPDWQRAQRVRILQEAEAEGKL